MPWSCRQYKLVKIRSWSLPDGRVRDSRERSRWQREARRRCGGGREGSDGSEGLGRLGQHRRARLRYHCEMVVLTRGTVSAKTRSMVVAPNSTSPIRPSIARLRAATSAARRRRTCAARGRRRFAVWQFGWQISKRVDLGRVSGLGRASDLAGMLDSVPVRVSACHGAGPSVTGDERHARVAACIGVAVHGRWGLGRRKLDRRLASRRMHQWMQR